MTADDARAAALALPEAVESAHFGKADFRVRGRIFASLPEPDRLVVKLTVEAQSMRVEAEPDVFAPVPGGWGRKGWTSVRLGAADRGILEDALATAWRTVAPRSLSGGSVQAVVAPAGGLSPKAR